MARLDRLRVEGYKSIAEADLALGDLNVLIGANGAGKSNLIGALGLLGSMVNEQLQLAVGLGGGASAILHRGSRRASALVLDVTMGRNRYEATLTSAPSDVLLFEQELVSFRDSGHARPWSEYLGSGTTESRLKIAAKSVTVAADCRDTMLSWQVFHFHDTSAAAAVKQKQPIDDNETLRPDGANLAALLYRIERTHPEHFQRIIDAVRLVAPYFRRFRLRPDRLNEQRIQLEWEQTNSSDYFNGHSLSDGTLRFILLTTLLLQPDPPSLIIIDEPELGLHPFAITQLADAFRAAARSRQLIVSTQSVTLLNQMDPHELIVTEQGPDGTQFSRPDWPALDAWLAEYAVGELWEKNVLGGRPR